MDCCRAQLDIDRNGKVDALTEGLLILRYLFGLTGDALITGALDPAGSRTTATDIHQSHHVGAGPKLTQAADFY